MPALAYPSDTESDIILRDGSTVRLRPVRETDAGQVLALFHELSELSLYYRFMMVPRIDLAQAQRIAAIDYDSQMVLVAERGGKFLGIAGYYRDASRPDRAEVAFAVADAMQGRGLGTRLLERLAEIGRDRGLTAFDAYVLGDNLPMMNVFLQSGFALTQGRDSGVFHVVLDLAPTALLTTASGRRSQIAAAASLRPFFEPRCIAVVGANAQPGRIGSEIFRNLRESGFTGDVVPVHPSAETVGGIRACRTVAEIRGEVDLAIVVVPAAGVARVVDDCLAKGVKAIVVISAGFGEIGPAGQALQAELVEKIRAAGVRMIGPNCMGIVNTDPAFRVNATFSPVYPPEGRIAFSTQSGALGLAILDYVKRLNIGISSFASIGNKADVSGNDLLQYWAADPRTDVILLYVESFGNPRKFAEIARRVGRTKPIVAVKAGRSDAGARAASSHTGARATSEVLVEAMLRESGVIRTRTLEELFDVASVLATQPVPAGRRVAIVTNAGRPAILAADACEAQGLSVPVLAEATQGALRAFLPPEASVNNPVDMIASATPAQYRQALEIVAADPAVDSIIAIFIPPLVTEPGAVAAAIRAAAGVIAKPVVANFLGTQGLGPQLAPVPSFTFPEAAAIALAHVARYGEWLRSRERPARCRTRSRRCGRSSNTPGRGRTGCRRPSASAPDVAGVPVLSPGAATADEAVAAARAVGFPRSQGGRRTSAQTDVSGVAQPGIGQAVRKAPRCPGWAILEASSCSLVSGQGMVVGGLSDRLRADGDVRHRRRLRLCSTTPRSACVRWAAGRPRARRVRAACAPGTAAHRGRRAGLPQYCARVAAASRVPGIHEWI
jgi:acetyl coenzyme A synthetase (ADP forming)-like protein